MGAPLPELTPQQQQFAEEYAKDKNGVRAALAVGLSTSYQAACEAASQLLRKPEMRQALRRIWGIQAKRIKTAVPDIVREWAVIGTSDVTDYVVGEDGKLGVAPGVPKAALRAVKKIKQTRSEHVKPGETVVEVRTEIELHDKLAALAKLHDHLHGVLPGEDRANANVELAARLAALLAARQPAAVGPGVPGGPVPGGEPVGAEPGAAGGGVPESGG